MFATVHSPPQKRTSNGDSRPSAPAIKEGFVRRRSGELDSMTTVTVKSPQYVAPAPKTSGKPVTKTKSSSVSAGGPKTVAPKSKEPMTLTRRMSEAKWKVGETKRKMDENTNMKRDVKAAIHECMETLLRLLKESEEENGKGHKIEEEREVQPADRTGKEEERKEEERKIIELLEGHGRLLTETKEEMEKLKDELKKQQEIVKDSYASVLAGPPIGKKPMEGRAIHSVVVSSKDEMETGEEVLEKIRVAVNAREEGVRVESVRKAKDRKVIIGCNTREEIGRVKEKLRASGKDLSIEEMINKDPLVVLRDVMKYNTDEQVIKGVRAQNKNLFTGLEPEDDRMAVKYRRRTRNLLVEHVVLTVSPKVWSRLTDAGAVHIDLQKVKVADQSPLTQCARCLAYGHSKRFCRDSVDVCSHCGGPHLRTECTSHLEGTAPKCVNCLAAKLDRADHNAFSEECPVRRRWDALARSTVQYC